MKKKTTIQASLLPQPYSICGVPVHPLYLTEFYTWMLQIIDMHQRASIMYANVHAINLAHHIAAFRATLHAADVVFCDGHGVRLASILLGKPLPARFTPPDWIEELASLCAQRQYRLFLLGAAPGVAAHAAAQLNHMLPALTIATHHGYFDPYGEANTHVLQRINTFNPHVLLVGMGMPLQEYWITDNLPWLNINIAIAVGALFDYMAEQIPRGPSWLTDTGFEWLCRLWFEPHRLWKRYILGNPYFFSILVRYIFQNRSRNTID